MDIIYYFIGFMKYIQKIQIIIFYLLVLSICVLFFVLGRVSIYWQDECDTPITGVNFASSSEIQAFIHELNNYEETSGINEIDIFEASQTENSMENAQFVASTRGKYYYEIGSTKANGLSEKSRVYFQTESDAKAHGYIKGN